MRFGLLVSVAGLALMTGSGCAVFATAACNVLAETKSIMEDCLEYKRDYRWAESAWTQFCQECPWLAGDVHYARGFKAGFAEHLYRGTVEPPAVPPPKYRSLWYQNPEGCAAVEQWRVGFRQGVSVARDGGYRRFVTCWLEVGNAGVVPPHPPGPPPPGEPPPSGGGAQPAGPTGVGPALPPFPVGPGTPAEPLPAPVPVAPESAPAPPQERAPGLLLPRPGEMLPSPRLVPPGTEEEEQAGAGREQVPASPWPEFPLQNKVRPGILLPPPQTPWSPGAAEGQSAGPGQEEPEQTFVTVPAPGPS